MEAYLKMNTILMCPIIIATLHYTIKLPVFEQNTISNVSQNYSYVTPCQKNSVLLTTLLKKYFLFGQILKLAEAANHFVIINIFGLFYR